MASPPRVNAPVADEASLITDAEFAAAMAALAPFEPAPRIAAGVSGGADSMALALLADAWARERGGSLLALVVDHGLRQGSGQEAAETRVRLNARGIAVRLLTIAGLVHGPALAERARAARFAALEAACAEAGIVHLLLGHHAGDQAETVLIRALGGSGASGLAGMASQIEAPRSAYSAAIACDVSGTAAGDADRCRYGVGRGPVECRSDRVAATASPVAR